MTPGLAAALTLLTALAIAYMVGAFDERWETPVLTALTAGCIVIAARTLTVWITAPGDTP